MTSKTSNKSTKKLKSVKKARTKSINRGKLYKECWKLMSEWIRKKDADWNGMTICYTCGAVKHYKETNAGHYNHNKLDFDPRNIKNQCIYCNKYLKGNLGKYAERLIRENGQEWLDKLNKDCQEKGNLYKVPELLEIKKSLIEELKKYE